MHIFFWQRPPALGAASRPIYGVNLGGWLLLEKWMTPSLFAGTRAEDEYSLCSIGSSAIKQRLQKHRDTFITRDDFVWLQQHGLQAVRLPVGYWLFDGDPPYVAAAEYVDKAFGWASETNIKILLDFHGAPGSQNGHDHSGRKGACTWHTEEANIAASLRVIEKLADTYGKHPALLGIELLNEPLSTIPRQTLQDFYEKAYRIIRERCTTDAWIVFSDGFKPRKWKRVLRQPDYTDTYIDSHQYQIFEQRDKRLDIAGHIHKTLRNVIGEIHGMQRYHPAIIGEWSIALDPLSMSGLTAQQKEQATRAYAAAQLIAYEHSAAWFYWSYKTEKGGTWSYRDCVDTGRLPAGYQKD